MTTPSNAELPSPTQEVRGRYRKIPRVVDAVQWHGQYNRMAFPSWFNDAWSECGTSSLNSVWKPNPFQGELCIFTLEGVMRANVGDWIIRGIKGELYPCKPDIFSATYEPVSRLQAEGEAAPPPQSVNAEMLAALEPFAKAHHDARERYARRYENRDLGRANFDNMPDIWPLEKVEFTMGDMRKAAAAYKRAQSQGADNG